jgi:hypothetical protein
MTNPQLGDMTVGFEPGDLPPRIWKALAVIAAYTHPTYEDFGVGTSKDKCLFTSLAIRDFFVAIGYTDATVRGCALYVYANDLQGKEIWSVGIGVPGQIDEPDKFNGHAVVTVPSLNLLLDPTMYQAQRSHWRDCITGMMAVAFYEPTDSSPTWLNMPVISGASHEYDDRIVSVLWADRPELPWRKSDDFRVRNFRRKVVTNTLCKVFETADTKKAPA